MRQKQQRKPKPCKPPRNARKLHLPDGLYHFRVRGFEAVIWKPGGDKVVARLDVVTGRDFSGLDRDMSKGNWTGIRPSMLRDFILRGYQPLRSATTVT